MRRPVFQPAFFQLKGEAVILLFTSIILSKETRGKVMSTILLFRSVSKMSP